METEPVAVAVVGKTRGIYNRIVNWFSWQIEKRKPSPLQKHAERELRLAGLFDKDSDYNGDLGVAVMGLIKVFCKQGHSGFSAGQTANLFKLVADYKPLTSLKGDEPEWGTVAGDDQNNRCGEIFRNEDGRCYHISAIVFQGQSGAFTGNSVALKDGSTIGSCQYIKQFPFKPKTFYIDVIETEWADKEEKVEKKGGGWWTSVIKNENQLKEVFEFYERYTI